MTEQSDKPSVDGLMPAMITRLATFAEHGQPKGYGGSDMMRADIKGALTLFAERLAALAGPLEQPQEPKSLKSYPVVAVGKDLPPARPEDTRDTAYPPMEGTWTLTAPDGRTWQADKPLRCVAAESRERIPAEVALQRIFDAASEDHDWQPIDTAPKDGDLIWLADHFSVRLGFWDTQPGGTWRDFQRAESLEPNDSLGFTPTAWQRVPLPPGESAGSARSDKKAASSAPESSLSVPKEQQ